MKVDDLLQKALNKEFMSVEEGVFLFEQAPTADLMQVGHELRMQHVPHNKVTWIIDRNSNSINVYLQNENSVFSTEYPNLVLDHGY